MRNKYLDLVDQTYDFPNDEFNLEGNELIFNKINLMDLIKQYGTPLKVSYLPKISSQIERARVMFNVAIAKAGYKGSYHYCYCTKSSHFSFVVEQALKSGVNLETSSAFDINIIENFHEQGLLPPDRYIICNGYKPKAYLESIARLVNQGFVNVLPILDNQEELDELAKMVKGKLQLGIRIASEEDPRFEFYTSRLGIRYRDVVSYYQEKIQGQKRFQLKMLHFFINTGIEDNGYYWDELRKCVNVYCDLKKICPELNSLNIGGGFPIKNSLQFNYEYEYMAEEIVSQIKEMCNNKGVPEPNIFTEFGSFTVGESGFTLFSILGQKRQNDRERWYMIDSSFMTTLPDTWALNKRFILFPINNWNKEYHRVFLGGLTCDSDDYYNSEAHTNAIYLPKLEKDNPQYIGFFYTGAYQESVGGFGGIQHCLTPAPKHVILDRDEDGQLTSRLFSKEQSYKSMLKILGY